MVDLDNAIIKKRRNWKGIVLDYDALIVSPADTSECMYCLTVPQTQALIAAAQTFAWSTRWQGWDGDQEAIQNFSDDLIKRLIMSCCCDDNQNPEILYRVSPDGTYQLQLSTDGGETWETDNSDPRLTYPAQPPLPSGTPNLKCQAAWNLRKGFEGVVSALATVLDASLTLFAISVAIAGVLIAFLLSPLEPFKLVPVVISLVNFLVGLTESEFTAAFDSTDYDKLQCAAYCLMNDAGQITDLSAFVAKICTDIDCTTIPGNTFRLICWGAGLLAINSMASTDRGTIGHDCSGCDCALCGFGWVVGTRFGDGSTPVGTIDSSGTDPTTGRHYKICSSANDGAGSQAIFLQSPGGNDDCCNINASDFEFISGGASVTSYVNCGFANTGANYNFGWSGTHNVRAMGLAAAVGSPFTVKIFFDLS